MQEVARFYEPEEARIAVGFLQSHGLAVELADNEALSAMPELRIGLGGFRILAEDRDVSVAKRLLAEVRADHADRLRCPSCHSNRIAKVRDLRFPLAHALLFVLFPFAPPTGELQCRTCKTIWRPDDDATEKDHPPHEPD